MKAKRVFLTGATGFIGGNLAKAFADRDLHVLVRAESRADSSIARENISLHAYDGTTQSVVKALQESKPDIVFHLAAYFVAEHKPGDVERLIASNLLLGAQVLEAMSVTGVRRLINTGTSWQHFHGDDVRPVTLYAATKQAFEIFVDYYVDKDKMSVITLKLFDTYGPRDPRPKLFHLLQTADLSKPLAMSGGMQLIDLVYIDDVAAAFLAAEQRVLHSGGAIHERFGVSSGDPRPLREIVELFLKLSQSSLQIEWGGRPYREREVMETWTGYVPVPGWKPVVTHEEGFRRLLQVCKEGDSPDHG
jgi:nucleoside-diphosphate-sugar epimerase